ncbi:hypothetical protein L3i22_065320 [Actinoplanes sp. L3-i22]|nr:hypothetical protein L3i22_065320 [Actinoplanes sp. L3-i22]
MVLAGAGLFVAGRATAGDKATAGSEKTAGDYAAGHADGLLEGRAEQAPVAARDAFEDGYRAGADDVFGGYDGGWGYSAYAITLVRGTNGITYRIASRTEMTAGAEYHLCPDGRSVCRG